jgi:hypothetical protein
MLIEPGKEKSTQFNLFEVDPDPVVVLPDKDKNEVIRDAIGFHVMSPDIDNVGIQPSVAIDGG